MGGILYEISNAAHLKISLKRQTIPACSTAAFYITGSLNSHFLDTPLAAWACIPCEVIIHKAKDKVTNEFGHVHSFRGCHKLPCVHYSLRIPHRPMITSSFNRN